MVGSTRAGSHSVIGWGEPQHSTATSTLRERTLLLTIAIVGGSGVATSVRLTQEIRRFLAERDIAARVRQATVMDLLSPYFSADIVVSTVELPESLGIPVVSGMPLLLGTGSDHVIDSLVDLIQAHGAA